MLTEHLEKIETLGLNLFFAAIFIFIGLSIQDVLEKGNVPKFGRYMVWLVLFLGCAGFIAKGVIKAFMGGSGV